MKLRLLGSLLTISAFAFGCGDKKDAAATPSASGTSAPGGAAKSGGDKAAPAPAVAKTPCPANFTKNAEGGFCVKTPDKWHAITTREMAGKKNYGYKDEFVNHSIDVEVGKYDGDQKNFNMSLDVELALIKDKPKLTVVNIPGGKFYSYEDPDGLWTASVFHDEKSVFKCNTRESVTDSSPDVPIVNTACKTILAQ